MDFGKVKDEDLNTIDFSLPRDHSATSLLLEKQKKKKLATYIGCAKWGRKDWIGKIYPNDTKEAEFLNHYAKHFNSIELNATFYRMPTEKQTSAWQKKVGNDFRFCPKFTGQITHIKRLKDVETLVEGFYKGIAGFGPNLGPILLMPHPGMAPKTLPVIEAFLQLQPKDVDIFVELRHKGWYSNTEIFEEAFSLLQKYKVGAVITDSAGRRDCLHMRLTTPSAFVRFVGNSLHPSDYTRINTWVERVKKWSNEGLKELYFFMHHHEELHSPELCKYLIEQLNGNLGTSIPVPQFIE